MAKNGFKWLATGWKWLQTAENGNKKKGLEMVKNSQKNC